MVVLIDLGGRTYLTVTNPDTSKIAEARRQAEGGLEHDGAAGAGATGQPADALDVPR